MSAEGVSDNRLYLINKDGDGVVYYILMNSDLSKIESHVLHGETWKPCCDVTDFGVAVVDDVIYVIGGFDQKAKKCSKKVFSYNPSTGKWTPKSSLFLSRCKMAVSVLNGRIHISGGEKTDGKSTGTCEVYDPVTDTWSKNGALRGSRTGHVTAQAGRELFCSGGRQGDEIHNNLWLSEGNKWEELDRHYPQKLPMSISNHVMATVDSTLYIAGGIQHATNENGASTNVTSGRTLAFSADVPTLEDSSEFQLFSPWNLMLPDMNYPRYNAGVSVLGERIYVFGGSRIEDGQEVKISEYFDTKELKWHNDYRFKTGTLGNISCALVRVTIKPDKLASPVEPKWILW